MGLENAATQADNAVGKIDDVIALLEQAELELKSGRDDTLIVTQAGLASDAAALLANIETFVTDVEGHRDDLIAEIV